MQNLPDRDILLQAVAGFLMKDVMPAVEDRALRFRVRIAAHLLATVSRELHAEEGEDAAQLERLLRALGHDPEPTLAGRDARHARIRALEAELAAAAQDGGGDRDAHLAAIRADLAARLSVINPRFDRSSRIEHPPD